MPKGSRQDSVWLGYLHWEKNSIHHYWIHYTLSVRVPGCQKLQMTAQPGLALDAFNL